MSDLIVNNHAVTPRAVIKIKAGQEQAAIAAAKKNGLDDVFFKVGNDTYAASSAGMGLRGAKAGDKVFLDGQKATLVTTNRQLDTFGEGLKSPAGILVGLGGAAWGAVVYATSIGAWRGLGVAIGLAGLAAGVAVNMFPALFGAFRKKDTEVLKPFAQ